MSRKIRVVVVRRRMVDGHPHVHQQLDVHLAMLPLGTTLSEFRHQAHIINRQLRVIHIANPHIIVIHLLVLPVDCRLLPTV
jgi:hypothetical protein